jgi:hypothetical protein
MIVDEERVDVVDMVSSILLLLDWREAKEEALVKGMVRVVLVELWSLEEMILEKSDEFLTPLNQHSGIVEELLPSCFA